jgi:RNA polymerase sigma-70 factor (ECF subfamily)
VPSSSHFERDTQDGNSILSEKSEKSLLAGLRRGDPRAQEQLLDLYGEPLVRFLVYVCQVDVPEAEDIAIEALYKAIDRIDTFIERPETGQHGFRNWLFTIARNLWRDQMRRRPKLVPIENLESLAAPLSKNEPAISSNTVQAVRQALRELPDSHRLTLVLHYGGLPLTEVAEILGARPGTVRQWKRRGLAKITRLLEAHPALTDFRESRSNPQAGGKR